MPMASGSQSRAFGERAGRMRAAGIAGSGDPAGRADNT